MKFWLALKTLVDIINRSQEVIKWLEAEKKRRNQMMYSIFKITLLVKRRQRLTRAGHGIDFTIRQQARRCLVSTVNGLLSVTELGARSIFVAFFRESNRKRSILVTFRNFLYNVMLI